MAPDQALRAIRGIMIKLDPDLTLFNVGSLKDELAFPLFPARIAASVLGAFGLLAIVRTLPVSWLVRVTFASGMMAPELSCTVPLICPVGDCAGARPQINRSTSAVHKIQRGLVLDID